MKSVPGTSLVVAVKTLGFQCKWCGFHPWWGTKIPHAVQRGQGGGNIYTYIYIKENSSKWLNIRSTEK